MSGAEAAFVIGLISGVISIIEATKTVYDTAKDAKGQPEEFRQVVARLPLVLEILQSAKARARALDEISEALEYILKSCKAKAEKLQEIFQKVIRKDDDKWYDRYKKAVSTLGKEGKVECLMEGILKDIQVLACERLMGTVTDAQVKEIEEAIKRMDEMPFSIQDEDEVGGVIQTHSGSGDNIGNTGGGTQNFHKGSGDLYYNAISGNASFGAKVQNATYNITSQFITISRNSSKLFSKVSPPEEKVTAIHKELQLGAKKQYALIPKSGFCTIRLERVSPFVGRAALLERLAARLQISGVALYGLGGAGKTEVVREYAIQLRNKAPTTSIFWIQAHTTLQFEQDYLKIAAHPDILGDAASGSADSISIIASIGRCLNTSDFGNWLIIVDNANDEAVFFNRKSPLDLIPVCPSGSVIFTTRNRNMGLRLVSFQGDNAIEVKSFDPTEAKRLLLIRTGSNELNDDEEKASELVAALEYLPLAISQAGGFIAVHGIPVPEYLRLYNATELSKINLLSDDSFESQQLDYEYFMNSAPVANTLMMSLQKMRESDRNLLAFMACLALRGTPKSLLLDYLDGNEIKLTKALGALSGYCLIDERRKGIFDMHALVYLVIRNWLRSTGAFDYWTGKSFAEVAGKFPSGRNRGKDTLSTGDLYLPHAETVLSYTEASTIKDIERAELAIRCSYHVQMQGLYEMAEAFARRAVDWGTSPCEQQDQETLANRSFLATTLRDQGKFQEAKDIDMDVLSRGKVLPDDHSVVLFSMESLSLTLSGLGMYEQAEELQRCVLKRRIRASGTNDIATLTTMNNLVTSLQAQGKWGEARTLGEETVQRKREVFGNGDLDTLFSVSNLALILQQTGDIDEAESMHREVLKGRENQLRKNHPLILVSMNNIGVVLHQKCQFTAAEEMYRNACGGAQEELGFRNPWTVTIMQNLSEALFEQGKYDEAEDLSQQVVTDRKIILGTDHEKTLSSGRTLDQIKAAKLASCVASQVSE